MTAATPTTKRLVAAATPGLCRRKLLDAVRGILSSQEEEELLSDKRRSKRGEKESLLMNNNKRRPLKCFRLEKHHIGSFVSPTKKTLVHHTDSGTSTARHPTLPQLPPSPIDFHTTLCNCIRNAKRRVILASLYIGPAANPITSPAELQLLQALQHAATNNNDDKSNVQITILLDYNRALRPVPVPKSNSNNANDKDGKKQFMTSAQACFQALHGGSGKSSKDISSSSSSSSSTTTTTTTTESSGGNKKIYLFSVLPDFWQKILGNNNSHHYHSPISEAAGVFHIKLYIVDDKLIISGANLSEEYFSNRHDRYLYIKNGGNGLVDCYAQLVEVLCQYAQEYHHHNNIHHDDTSIGQRRIGASELMRLVAQVLTTNEEKTADSDYYNDLLDDENTVTSSTNIDNNNNTSTTWAYAVPTFQSPLHFQQDYFMRSDVETIRNWIQYASSSSSSSTATNIHAAATATGGGVSLRVASAYLNPTKTFQEMLHRCCNLDMVHYLTAGRISHGFTTKTIQQQPVGAATTNDSSSSTSSNITSMVDGATTKTTTTMTTDHHPRRDWIPTLFDATARQVLSRNNDKWKQNIHLWFYQRPNWTFHAKGLWLCSNSGTTTINNSSSSNHKSQSSSSRLEIDEQHQVLFGCTHGSGNYGARSEYRDLESNLILTFPARSPLAKQHVEEWNAMCAAAVPWTQEPKQQMSWPLRLIFPWIQSFF